MKEPCMRCIKNAANAARLLHINGKFLNFAPQFWATKAYACRNRLHPIAPRTYWDCPWLRSRENDAKLPRNRP